MSERLHPQSWRELRKLVQLHGADAIVRAIRDIADQPNRCPYTFNGYRCELQEGHSGGHERNLKRRSDEIKT